MKRIIAMVPARIGSKRVPKKNIRLIDGKPLVAYILETIKQSTLFDEIYLNADDLIFERIAQEYDVKFHYRDKKFSTDSATNDDFALDFMQNVDGDILIQVLPTSPLVSLDEIQAFTSHMIKNNLNTLISVEHKQIACLHKNTALNFDKFKKNPPSQEMEPIKAYTTVLMGWEYKSFISNMKKYGCGYHGCDSKVGYYELNGLSTIDIDNEKDFLLAEAIILALKKQKKKEIKFYE